ncbi:MAG: hypothetical protein R3E53_06000 [Myxococcota bacterium]
MFYALPRGDSNRLPTLASPRDSEASAQLRVALHEVEGFGFGRSILNFPEARVSYDLRPVETLRPIRLPFLHEGDVIFKTTRPPLSDGKHCDNKKVEPSNNVLERLIFFHYWRYLDECARSFVRLTDEAARALPRDRRNRQEMTFYQVGCRYKFLQQPGRRRSRRGPLGERTAAFLLRVDALWENGPGLVCAWGMNAEVTLGWCTLLRFRYPALLENRGLTVVEIAPTQRPESPTTHDWVFDWQVSPLLATNGELPARPGERPLPVAWAH